MLPLGQAARTWTATVAVAAGLLLAGALPGRAQPDPQVRVVVESTRARISGIRVVRGQGSLSVQGRATRNSSSLVRHRIELVLTGPDGSVLAAACTEPRRSSRRGRQTTSFRARIQLPDPPPAGSVLRIRDAASPCPHTGR